MTGIASGQAIYNGGTGLWNTAANWTPSGVPAATAVATFNNNALTSVRLDGATATSSNLSFGNGGTFSIGNASGDTAKITHSTKTVTVTDTGSYLINLTNGGGTTTTSTGAYDITSATFNIASGGKLTLDGRYYGNSGAVRTITKSTGTGTLELRGNYTDTFITATLSAGTLVLNGTGANSRLIGLGSIANGATLRFASSNTNLISGTSSFHTSTGIRLISGTVDLNGFNNSTTRIQGTASTGVITNNGSADAVLTLGNFGTTTGLATNVTAPVFGGLIKDGTTRKLGLTLTSGGTSVLTQTLTQTPTYTGSTVIQGGGALVTPSLSGASAITLNNGTLITSGSLSNTAGILVNGGLLDVRGSLFSGPFAISAGTARFSSGTNSVFTNSSLSQTGGVIDLDVSGSSADRISTTGSLSISGGTIKAVLNGAPSGPFVLAEYGSLTGTPTVDFSPAVATTRFSSPTVDAVTGNKITVGLTGAAADLVWTGAATGDWNLSDLNWDNGGSGSAFFNLDMVSFTNAAGTKAVNLSSTVVATKITVFNTGFDDYTISGTGGIGGLAEGLIKNGDAWLTLGGVNTFTGPVQINSGKVILNSPQALGFSSGVSVLDNVDPALSGQLDLKGQNVVDSGRTYSVSIEGNGYDGGGAIINSGSSLIISGVGKSGLRNLTLTADASVGGTVDYDIGTNGSIIGGGFTLTKRGSAVLNINAPITGGNLTVAGGTVYLATPQSAGNALTILSGAKVQTGASGTYTTNVTLNDNATLDNYLGGETTFTGTFTLTGTPVFQTENTTNLIIDSVLSTAGGIKTAAPFGSAAVVFLRNNSIAGPVNVTKGSRLQLGNGGSTGSVGSANVVFTDGGLTGLILNRSDDFNFSNSLSGAGALTKQGTNTVRLTGNNTHTSATSVSAGTLIIGDGATSGTPGSAGLTISDGATATFDRSDALTLAGVLGRVGTAGTGIVNKLGAGSLNLNGASGTFSGTFNVQAGTLVANATNPWGNAANTPKFNLSPGSTLTNGTSDHAHVGAISLNNATWTTGNGTTSYNGENYQLNGNVTVTGSAPSVISRDPSRNDANSGVSLSGNRTFTVEDVTGNGNVDLTITTELEASDTDTGATQSALTKSGAGTLNITTPATYTAGTTVSQGNLRVSNPSGSGTGTGVVAVSGGATLSGTGTISGAVTSAGTIAPGASVGTLTTGATTLTGALAIEVDGSTADRLNVNGNLNVSGASLTVTVLSGGFTQSSYIIAQTTGGTVSGTFASVPAGYLVSYSSSQITLTTVYQSWINSYTSLTNPADKLLTADPDGDGRNNRLEFALGSNPTIGTEDLTNSKIGDPDGAGPAVSALVLTTRVRNGATFATSSGDLVSTIDGITYRIEGSNDLSSWSLPIVEVSPNSTFTSGLPAAPTGWTYRSFRAPGEVSGNPKVFLRVGAE